MFLKDSELKDRLNLPVKRYRSILRALDIEGLPKPDPLVGARWWPAVKQWLNRRYATVEYPRADYGLEGENWHALTRKRPRPKGAAKG